jgi:hypothetical protein
MTKRRRALAEAMTMGYAEGWKHRSPTMASSEVQIAGAQCELDTAILLAFERALVA